MDHKERFLSFFEGKIPDRTPLFLRDFTLGLDNLGCKTTDLIGERYDSSLASKSVISFGRMTGQDAIVGCVHTPAFLVEQFGGTMKVPECGIPMPIVHPISSPDALDRADTSLKGKALDAVEAYHITKRDCSDLAIIGNVTGPLTKASVLMGMDVLSLAIHSDIDFVKGVIDTGMEATYSFMEAIRDDVDVFFFASASDNPSLFGNDIVNTVSVPYVKQLSDFTHRMDRPNIYHPHGEYTCKELMDPMVSTGIDCFHFAEANDHCVICKLINDRCIVMGGTNIVPTLYSGTEKEIVDETKKFLNACSNRRFIFSCSCSLQRGVPLESIRVMCDTVINHIGTLRF